MDDVNDVLDVEAKHGELLEQARTARTAELLNDLGAVEAMRGAPEAAVVHLRSASLLDPENDDIRANLGHVLSQQRDAHHPDAQSAVAHSLPRPSAPPESESLPADDALVAPADPAAEPVPDAGPFAGHYYEWRRKRVHAIVRRYGPSWFTGARVLELGCGHGDIGAMLLTLGADVTFSEGRREHLDVIAERYPGVPANRLVAYDAEHPWPFEERFDLVINMGLVYHVDNWQRSIIGSLRSSDHVVLETEVCDSDDPALVVKTVEEGPDQAISGVGSRPSAPAVEALLRAEGFRFERISDNRCNAGFHRYDWPVTRTGAWEHGLRRFWFAWRR